MRTIIETPTFQRQADGLWSADERLAFFVWLAVNPEAGEVIPGAGGARKVRWSLPGTGKRGGARVIYFNEAENGTLLLVMMYAKGQRENVSSGDIKRA
ncbi:MAG: DNA-binding protein, partial [Pseudomonadota bacterium]|nr:DNA-binding protein [Pseudomonadota bacterium]